MNTAFGIVSGLIVLLATMFILKKRKKSSSCISKETLVSKPKVPEPDKQQSENKPVTKVEVAANAEPTPVNSKIADAPVISSPTPESVMPISNVESFAKPQVKEAAALAAENNGSEFPEDSILRRHYFNHFFTMIEALAPQRPTDPVLYRHYYMMLLTRIDQCLNDKEAMEQLIHEYENLRM